MVGAEEIFTLLGEDEKGNFNFLAELGVKALNFLLNLLRALDQEGKHLWRGSLGGRWGGTRCQVLRLRWWCTASPGWAGPCLCWRRWRWRFAQALGTWRRTLKRARALCGGAQNPSHQLRWTCTKPVSKRKVVFLQGSVHFNVSWWEAKTNRRF